MNLPNDGLFILFSACVLIAAAVFDLRYQKIPNALTFPTILIALAYAGFARGLDGLLFSAGGLVLGMGILIVPYLMGGMGAGDVKLLGAVGAILGPLGVVNAFVLTAFIGVIYAGLFVLLRYRRTGGFAARLATMFKTYLRTGQLIYIPTPEGEEKPKLCYGIAIALGALCTIGWKLSHHSFLISSFT
jgi:prepilin peptidase CpaA